MIPILNRFFQGALAVPRFIYHSTLFSVKQATALGLSVPYVLWKMLTSPGKDGSQPLSKWFRRIFEHRRTRQIVGVHLLTALLVFTVIHVPVIANDTVSEPKMSFQPKETIEMAITSQPVTSTETTFKAPVPGYISQHFSWYHPGMDIAGNDFQPVYPITSGVVVLIEDGAYGYGRTVMIDHGNELISRYAHLYNIEVQLNQEVTHKTVLGTVGSTGYSTGPHLHLEIYDHGVVINPLAIIPNEYPETYVNLAVVSQEESHDVPVNIASAQPTGGLNQSYTASISAQINRQVAEGFVEPMAYQMATGSAMLVPEATNASASAAFGIFSK